MASLRETRRKIKSVKSTEQITKAMKMVAAARMRKSQAAILSSRPFAVKMEELVGSLAAGEAAAAQGTEQPSAHPFFEKKENGTPALLMVTADKGLCGAFNSNLLKAAMRWLRENEGKKAAVWVVGRKARDFFKKVRGFDFEVLNELTGIFPKVTFAHAELLGKGIMETFLNNEIKEVTVLYNEFKSVASQRIVTAPLLPIVPVKSEEKTSEAAAHSYEPGRAELLEALLPRYVKAQIYRILLESQAAELAARMNAMDAASKNAKELREALNLALNRRRQAMITGEIAELVSGAEALVS